MMKIDDGHTYVPDVTPGILETYSARAQIDLHRATCQECKLFFVYILKDFLENRLSVDNFCYMTTILFYDIKGGTDFFFDSDSKLADLLWLSTETTYLNWRKATTEYEEILQKLVDYYSKNKHLIEEL